MHLALKQAMLAQSKKEVPVGCVIVKDNQLVSSGFNSPISSNDASAHAEINAIRSAGKKIKNYRLNDMDIYVTLQPCPMCISTIINARISKIFFGAYEKKNLSFDFMQSRISKNSPAMIGGILEKECASILSDFFKNKR